MSAAQRERHKDLPDVWSAALILVLLIGLEVVIGAGFRDAGLRGPENLDVVTVFACGIVFSFLLSYKNLGYGELFHSSSRSVAETMRPMVVPLLLTTAGSIVLADEVNNVLLHLFPMSQSQLDTFAGMVSGGVVSAITTCVVAPFVEEMLFRGLFLRSFLWNYGPARAIVFSSLLFGAAHLNVYQFVIASTLGLLSGWLYVATRSLWPCIFEHAIYNAGVTLHYVGSGGQPKAAAVSVPVHNPLVLLLATASFALGVYWIYLASRRLTAAPREPHAGGA